MWPMPTPPTMSSTIIVCSSLLRFTPRVYRLQKSSWTMHLLVAIMAICWACSITTRVLHHGLTFSVQLGRSTMCAHWLNGVSASIGRCVPFGSLWKSASGKRVGGLRFLYWFISPSTQQDALLRVAIASATQTIRSTKRTRSLRWLNNSISCNSCADYRCPPRRHNYQCWHAPR